MAPKYEIYCNCNIVIDISSPVPYVAEFWFSSYGPKYCRPIKLQDSWKSSILRNKWMMNCIFDLQINIEVFYKLVLSFWVCVGKQAQSTQNNLAYLRNISKKRVEWSWYFDRWKAKVFYKLIVSHGRHAQSTQNDKFSRSLQYLKKNVKDEVVFFACRQTSKVSSNWYCHFRCVCVSRHVQIT